MPNVSIRRLWLALALLISISSAEAGDVAGRAKAYIERLKAEAQIAVAGASDRVRLAAENLQQAQTIAQMARDSRDAVATAVANNAVTEASYGVHARRLLDRSNTLLAMREKQAEEMPRLEYREQGKPGKLRGMMLNLGGEVHIFDSQGKSVSDPLRPLQLGDRVVTGKDGTARLILAGGDADALLEPGSAMKITKDDLDAGFLADLENGATKIRAKIQAWGKRRFEVRTPWGGGAVRGTEIFMHALPEGMRVGVWEGKVNVTPSAAGDEVVELNVGEEREWTHIGGWGSTKSVGNSTRRIDWGD